MDAIKNFTKVNVSTGYDASATTVVLATGEGAKLPDPAIANFNLVWFNNKDYGDPADDPNVSIVRVTGKSGDTLTVVQPSAGNDYNGETSANTAKDHNIVGKTWQMVLAPTYKIFKEINDSVLATLSSGRVNLLKNGNFINNSTNGYGSTADAWTSSNANPVQGGFPSMTKAELISLLGISDGDIEGLWNLNEASGNALDLSSNGYHLTDTNTVGSSDDGLMGKARSFSGANTEYFTIADANCPNLEISGSQTWIAFIKPSAETAYTGGVMAKRGTGTKRFVNCEAGASPSFQLAGLTTTSFLASDVVLEANKWYMIVGRYNSVSTELSIWVNAVKKTATASGSATDADGDFWVGRSSSAGEYYDGLVQTAMILSVALSDAQIKRLWAFLTYRGQKIRRATNNATYSQSLEQDLVERLRGKTITLRGSGYCSSTNHGIYITTDGTGGTTTSDTPSSANAWETLSVTVTVPTDATSITVGLMANTTDGSSWFKELALYEGSVALPYTHSPDDWSRFPRLLRMDIPQMYGGKPYQYEENRWYSYIPTFTASGSMTYTVSTIYVAQFMFTGKQSTVRIRVNGTCGGSASSSLFATIGIKSIVASNYAGYGGMFRDGGTYGAGYGDISDNKLSISKYNGANFSVAVNQEMGFIVIYDIE